VEKYRL